MEQRASSSEHGASSMELRAIREEQSGKSKGKETIPLRSGRSVEGYLFRVRMKVVILRLREYFRSRASRRRHLTSSTEPCAIERNR